MEKRRAAIRSITLHQDDTVNQKVRRNELKSTKGCMALGKHQREVSSLSTIPFMGRNASILWTCMGAGPQVEQKLFAPRETYLVWREKPVDCWVHIGGGILSRK